MSSKGIENLNAVIEALIFASDEPITLDSLRQIVEDVTPSQIKKAIDELNQALRETQRSFHIVYVAGGVQMVTREDFAPWVKRMYQKKSRSRLSHAALETLSVIAFKQPITKIDVAAIRGVNCDGVVKTLLERKLITMAGRAEGPGRPLLYKTTKEFLRYFGINRISDLPKPREIEELLKDKDNLPEAISADELHLISDVAPADAESEDTAEESEVIETSDPPEDAAKEDE